MKVISIIVMSVLMSVLLSQNCQCEIGRVAPISITDSIGHVKKLSMKSDSVSLANKKIAQKESIRQELVNEVDKYISKKAYRQRFHKDISEHLVEVSLKNNFDIAFAMAQAEIETCYGTTGIGISRRSMYGVYITYKNLNASTDYYINMIQQKYLGNKRSINDLIKNYVTLKGSKRYSSNIKYESLLKKKWKDISTNTKISRLQKQYENID